MKFAETGVKVSDTGSRRAKALTTFGLLGALFELHFVARAQAPTDKKYSRPSKAGSPVSRATSASLEIPSAQSL